MQMNPKINILSISRLRTYTDGDGITSLVISAGCPLRCAYCLNPNTWDGTLQPKSITVDELYEELKRDNIYFLSTGGGVSFGGGEPLLQHEFIKEFIKKYKSTKWKFYLETSLSTDLESLKDVIDLIDYFYVDCKDMVKARYELYTKGDYDLFLNNLTYLKDHIDGDKIKIRVPKIKELHKRFEFMESYEKLRSMGFENIQTVDYIDEVEKYKEISKIAIENREDFLEKIKKNRLK